MCKQPEHAPLRRQLLAAVAALAASGGGSAAPAVRGASGADTTHAGARSLVVYFSRSGNTRVIAGVLQRMLAADLHEIVPATPYPEDYEATVALATRERNSGFEPALTGRVAGLAGYDTVFLGFPVWGTSVPPVIRSFLRTHELAGKTLIPFITHGGYGTGDSLSVLARHAPQAHLGKAFVLQCDQERTSIDRLKGWLKDSGIRS